MNDRLSDSDEFILFSLNDCIDKTKQMLTFGLSDMRIVIEFGEIPLQPESIDVARMKNARGGRVRLGF